MTEKMKRIINNSRKNGMIVVLLKNGYHVQELAEIFGYTEDKVKEIYNKCVKQ